MSLIQYRPIHKPAAMASTLTNAATQRIRSLILFTRCMAWSTGTAACSNAMVSPVTETTGWLATYRPSAGNRADTASARAKAPVSRISNGSPWLPRVAKSMT